MSIDTLSELLRAVRLRGAVFYYVDGIAPWAAEAPAAHEIASSILPGCEHVIEYHVVTQGKCWGALPGEQAVCLETGDVIMFPQGDAHVMSSAPGLRANRSGDELYFSPRPTQLPYVLTLHGEEGCTSARLDGGGAERSTVMCGFLGCDARPFNPLLAALPRLLHLSGAADERGWVGHFTQLAVREANAKSAGGEAMLERLSELMFIDVVRRYLDQLPVEQKGWLAGLRDRFVGRTLSLLHERPSHRWTMDELAEAVGLSRSALYERFVGFVGQPPMQYLARWRMQIASRMLLQTTRNVAAVAQEAGYESEAAFSRAFKREVGMPPASWRRMRIGADRPATQPANRAQPAH